MGGLNDFAKKVTTLASDIPINAAELQKSIGRSVLRQVAADTPVDTGRAISNWQVGSGNPELSFLDEAYIPGESGSTEGQNIEAAVEIGTAKINKHQSGDLFISNNAHYIGDLNDGFSKQAPKHFVQLAVQAGTITAIKKSILTGK